MIQVCDLSFANSSITDTLGNYSLVSSGTVTIDSHAYPANTDPILYVTDSSYSCIEFGQTATYSNGAIIQAGIPDYGSENWAVEFRARVPSVPPVNTRPHVLFFGCSAPYDDNGTIMTGGYWAISIDASLNTLDELRFFYDYNNEDLTLKDNLDFTAWHLYRVTKTAEDILTLHIDGVLVATIDIEQHKGFKSRATLGSFALLGAVDEFPTTNHIQTNQVVRLADVKVYADPMGHAEKAISLDNLSRVFRNYNTWLGAQLSGQIGDGTLTIKVNGATAGTFTANASTNATANITVPTAVSELTNDSGYLTSSSNLDASKLTSGTVDIERLPQGALERLIKVANEAARYALTTADVQLGDTVQQLDTGIMYIVTDADHLDSAAGYTEYTAGTAASVPWSGVTGKPTFAAVATSGAYSDLTGTPTIPTVNNATLTIQKNGVNVQTFTANASTNATANIQCVDLNSNQTVAGDKTFSGNTKFTASATIEKSGGDVELLIKNTAIDSTSVSANAVDDIRFVDSSNRITGSMRISYDTSNGVTAMMYARSYSADGSVSSTNGISITSNQQTGAARASVSANLLPNSTDTYDLGSSALQWNNAYIKSLTINGVACGDILTHNASEFVPRSGGAVITGSYLANNTDDSYLIFRGGRTAGGTIASYGKYYSNKAGQIELSPWDGTTSKNMILAPSGTWTWNGTACQITSDQRLKQQIAEIDDKLLDAWQDVNLVQFKYNDAVNEKGTNARLHTGYVVQQIDKACKSHNVDISEYGLYCHEEYPEETEEVEVEQKDGTKTKETKVIREASEHYSLRYTEVYAVECMYLRRCIARLTARIEELEKEREASK